MYAINKDNVKMETQSANRLCSKVKDRKPIMPIGFQQYMTHWLENHTRYTQQIDYGSNLTTALI